MNCLGVSSCRSEPRSPCRQASRRARTSLARRLWPGDQTFSRLLSLPNHISPAWRNGRSAPLFFEKGRSLQDVRRTEKTLQREVTQQVEAGLPGIEVLAVELVSPQRFCVYVDHPAGVDHALCERVTNVLRGYLDRYTVDVSSPGLERPLRKPQHFRQAVGRRVALRTPERKRLRGQVVDAGERAVVVRTENEEIEIPYEQIV